MAYYLYLSLLPEALVASMLPPKEFGTYLAVGTQKRSRGPAMFFELDRFDSDYFDLSGVEERCVPHPDGQPKHSVYLSIYRVLEHVPMQAIGSLFLTTQDGRVLEVAAGSGLPAHPTQKYHLYQEIGPVHPRIVSTLEPREFCSFITDPKRKMNVPRILFVEMRLGELADNPATGSIRDLPYTGVEHLRDCLIQLRDTSGKHTKTVDRLQTEHFPYRTVENGFFLGSGAECRYYPFPAWNDLQTRYYEWWRSATA